MRIGAGGRGLYTEERKAGVHDGVEEFSRGSKVRQRSNQQRTSLLPFLSIYRHKHYCLTLCLLLAQIAQIVVIL